MKSKKTRKIGIQGATGAWMAVVGAFLVVTNTRMNFVAASAMVVLILGDSLLASSYYKSLKIATTDEWDDIKYDNVA